MPIYAEQALARARIGRNIAGAILEASFARLHQPCTTASTVDANSGKILIEPTHAVVVVPC